MDIFIYFQHTLPCWKQKTFDFNPNTSVATAKITIIWVITQRQRTIDIIIIIHSKWQGQVSQSDYIFIRPIKTLSWKWQFHHSFQLSNGVRLPTYHFDIKCCLVTKGVSLWKTSSWLCYTYNEVRQSHSCVIFLKSVHRSATWPSY